MLVLYHLSPTLKLTHCVGWYGYHIPRVRARDTFYAKLEDQRAKDAGLS